MYVKCDRHSCSGGYTNNVKYIPVLLATLLFALSSYDVVILIQQCHVHMN